MTTRAWDQRDELVPRGFPGLRRGRLLRRRRTRPGLQAVLWDMDGLLVDTEPVWTIAEEQLAARLGGTWSEELKAQIVGTRLDASVPTILQWYGVDPTPPLVAETTTWLLARMVELFATEVRALPGVTELLAALTHDEIPMALVSSSYRVLVDAVLAHGFGPFPVTVAGDEVIRGKPDPEPYRLACERLNVDPEQCVVLEDSPSGVASGEAAGCRVVAVPSVPAVVITPAAGRLVRPSLVGVEVDALRSLVA
ncbi:MAG: HAD-superfamily hydrolase, subfamily variant 3 [Frankiales bacterium]|jgi:HAD superfamily hydrolase (TIGR01509 family)|nr:HAD-superfamily hydrolase, subfamily variant 3 [Frankiales bacterium]